MRRNCIQRSTFVIDKHGMIAQDADGRIRVTQQGFPVLDAIVADLAA